MMKEKSVFKKYEFEYESPDGDKWDITIADSGDRKYVQYGKAGEESPITIDGEMLLDMSDAYRNVTSRLGSSSQFKGIDKQKLVNPNITDHRGLERSESIQASVDESMQNQDDTVEPVQSFSPAANTRAVVADYTQFRSGVSPEEASESAGETPEEWALSADTDEMAAWKKDALHRRGKPRPATSRRTGGAMRPDFKKVGAKDII